MAKVTDGKKVATVHGTYKGQHLTDGNDEILGGKGVDGRKRYYIYKQGIGRWTCTCMAYRFTKGKVGEKPPCKHMKALFSGIEVGSLPVTFEIHEPAEIA
jgi:predicted nucleic acid-binding Zn finger protein